MKIPATCSWLCLTLICVTLFSVVCGQCVESQKSVLLHLKKSFEYRPLSLSVKSNLEFNPFGKLVGWNRITDCCLWNGVTCDVSGLVTGLDLSSEYVSPRSGNWTPLFDFKSLQALNLADNWFNSTIPGELSRLTSLKFLNLSNAGFFGQVPIQISRMTRLNSLDLSSYNNLTLENPNFAKLVRNLSGLTELHLDDIDLSSNEYEWCHVLSSSVPKLRVLSLSRCSLSGPVDSSLLNLRSISVLRLDDNNFSATDPNFFAGFSNLTELSLSHCELGGQLPKQIFRASTLQSIDLSGNEKLEGLLPEFSQHGSLQTLVHIDLSNNVFSGEIPPGWEGLQNLVNLDLSGNSLSGIIPEFLFSLPSLQRMILSYNQFSGGLKVSNVSSTYLLRFVDLRNNKLTGPLPISLFNLRGLEHLDLSSNNFSGSLKLDVLQHVTNLSYIDFSYNSLSVDATDSKLPSSKMTTFRMVACKLRSFPVFLKSPSMLYDLDLSVNQIHGSIPSWVWEIGLQQLNLSFNSLTSLDAPIPSISSLFYLDLHSNQLQGPIPTLPKSAVYLDYSINNFTSTIPSDIGSYLHDAIFFSLSNNNIHGNIPASVCNVTNLDLIDLSNNSLTGMIPGCLMYNMTLSVINLRRNNLSGSIEDSFLTDCRLNTLDLSGNLIQGKIPKSLANCQYLEVLNLGSNLMSDTFPCHMKNATTNMQVLILRHNQFYGHIHCPKSSGTWERLQIVDLSSNKFSGKLPRDEIKTWKAMMLHKDEIEPELNYIQHEVMSWASQYEASSLYYDDAVSVANKGLEMELVKILTVFTCIDLSSNIFEGSMPQELGNFRSLHVLNLSRNALTGGIPSVLGNLAQLESLDLSFNHLNGAIPAELATLNFLSFLNLSHNQLAGKIPVGSQLQTFGESSFRDNLALCGSPLDAAPCTSGSGSSSGPEQAPRTKFDLQVVYGGVLGFALGSGVVLGGLLFTRRGSKWCDSVIDHIHFGVLHPSWFIHSLLDSCRSKRM